MTTVLISVEACVFSVNTSFKPSRITSWLIFTYINCLVMFRPLCELKQERIRTALTSQSAVRDVTASRGRNRPYLSTLRNRTGTVNRFCPILPFVHLSLCLHVYPPTERDTMMRSEIRSFSPPGEYVHAYNMTQYLTFLAQVGESFHCLSWPAA